VPCRFVHRIDPSRPHPPRSSQDGSPSGPATALHKKKKNAAEPFAVRHDSPREPRAAGERNCWICSRHGTFVRSSGAAWWVWTSGRTVIRRFGDSALTCASRAGWGGEAGSGAYRGSSFAAECWRGLPCRTEGSCSILLRPCSRIPPCRVGWIFSPFTTRWIRRSGRLIAVWCLGQYLAAVAGSTFFDSMLSGR